MLSAKDVVEADFISVTKEANAFETAKEMKKRKHGYAIVMDAANKPQGIVTEWDYMSKIVAEGKDPANVKVSEIMTTGVVAVPSGEDIIAIAKLMHEKGIRRVLVLEGSKILGIITAKDVLASLEEYTNRLSSQIARLQHPVF